MGGKGLPVLKRDCREIPVRKYSVNHIVQGKLSRSPYRGHRVLCAGVRHRVNHSEVYGRCSKINAFIRIRLSRLFTTLVVKTKKSIRLSKFKETKKTTNSTP